ncbi:hypothetical protein AAE478_010188 [Parahypoxylon ruwenzoriense]
MVLLAMTPSIVEALKELAHASNDDIPQGDKSNSNLIDSHGNDEPSLKNPSVGNPVSHGQILDIWERSKNTSSRARLEELLRGATVYVPPPPPKPEPTDEYKALMARLRREEEERSYERMLKKGPRESLNRPSNPSDVGDDIEHGDLQKQITLIINFLVSIFGCAAALWMAARWWSVPARLFLSLGGSIIVAIAEVAVYSAYTWRMAEGEKNQKKMKEVKQIVQTWVVGEDDDDKKGNDEPSNLVEDELKHESNVRRRVKAPS